MKFRKKGKTVDLHFDDDHFNSLVKAGDFHEGAMLDIIADMNIEGVYLDIGANQGNHSVYFSLFTRATLVLAFEPIWHNFLYMMGNIYTNNCHDIVPLMYGVGEKQEFVGMKAHNNGRWPCVSLDGEGIIPVITIDSLHLDQCALMKIDVEGMEAAVIRGAIETIKKFTPVIFVEIWTDEEMQEIERLLLPLGYKRIERYNDAPTYLFKT